jgi:hypothetical protein
MTAKPSQRKTSKKDKNNDSLYKSFIRLQDFALGARACPDRDRNSTGIYQMYWASL